LIFDFAKLNDSNHTFVIAEAGSNWKTNSNTNALEQVEKLVEIAASCGADAVKFQMFRSKTLYAHRPGSSDYLKKNGIGTDVGEMFENLEMPYHIVPEIHKICKKNNIMFMSSVFSIDDAKIIDPFVEIHKIASYEINHVRLLEFVAKTKKPVIISTGASTYDEIDFAVNLIKNYNDKIALLQCTAKYPVPIESLNLFVIPELEKKYGLPVGFSDHSEDPIIGPVTAVGLGARIVEKHFTTNKNNEGPDHRFALDPNELRIMIRSIRRSDLAKGSSTKTILLEERELMQFATRSIQATKNIRKGDILLEGINFDVLRPGNKKRGLDARFLSKVIGKKSAIDVEIGDGILELE